MRISQQQLESYLWGAATLLRGTIDAGDYKQFIFPLLFYKRLCDVFEAYRTLFPKSELNFEQTVLIAVGLAQGDVIELGRCLSCPRTILIDLLAAGDAVCSACRSNDAPGGCEG